MTPDKQLHLLLGAVLAFVGAVVVDEQSGFLFSVTLSGAKEVHDLLGYGTPDPLDFIAGAVGAWFGAKLGGLF